MPRTARHSSRTGFLHLIMRGISRQVLFEDRSDYQKYLAVLRRYAEETHIKICAYCLMENHVHLLIHDGQNQTSLFAKKVGVSYSIYFNKKHDRGGHLFQDRYLSEAVESEAYLFAAFRYILNNPAKAGICPASEYEWSSYRSFGENSGFVDSTPFLGRIRNKDELKSFVSAESRGMVFMEYQGKRTDDWAREQIRELLKIPYGTYLQQLPREERNASIRILKQAGLSIRQIERLTGIGRNIVQKA